MKLFDFLFKKKEKATPAPVQETPAKEEVAPAPKKEEAPAPKKEEAPAPKKEEAPAPKKEEAPAPKKEEAPAPKKEEAPAPAEEAPFDPNAAIKEVRFTKTKAGFSLKTAVLPGEASVEVKLVQNIVKEDGKKGTKAVFNGTFDIPAGETNPLFKIECASEGLASVTLQVTHTYEGASFKFKKTYTY